MSDPIQKLKAERIKLAVQMAKLDQLIAAKQEEIANLKKEIEEAKRYQ